jgi:hypothetical protein
MTDISESPININKNTKIMKDLSSKNHLVEGTSAYRKSMKSRKSKYDEEDSATPASYARNEGGAQS